MPADLYQAKLGYLSGKSPLPRSEPGLYFPMPGRTVHPPNPPDRMTTQGPGKAGILTHLLTEALWTLSGRGGPPLPPPLGPGDLVHLSP